MNRKLAALTLTVLAMEPAIVTTVMIAVGEWQAQVPRTACRASTGATAVG